MGNQPLECLPQEKEETGDDTSGSKEETEPMPNDAVVPKKDPVKLCTF